MAKGKKLNPNEMRQALAEKYGTGVYAWQRKQIEKSMEKFGLTEKDVPEDLLVGIGGGNGSIPFGSIPNRPERKQWGSGVAKVRGNPNNEIMMKILTTLENPALNEKVAERLLNVLEKLA